MQDLSTSIEKLKKTQDQLLLSQKMEAIGQLAGGVAHDFNNLLTAIGGYANLMLINDDVGESARAEVREIQKTVKRAADLVNQLLAFGRRQVLRPEPVGVNDTLLGLEGVIKRLIGESVGYRCECGDDAGTVVVDAGQLEQVIINLALNARDAMPNGGVLTIATGSVASDSPLMAGIPDARQGSYSVLTVSDTGAGIPDDVRSRLFEPFFTTKPEGTGLGLATVHGIVTQSGGYVIVESTVGSGSTFRIFLPRSALPAADASTAGPSETASVVGAARVLVVEDEASLRETIARVLREHGYSVRTAGTGKQALALYRDGNGRFDLVVTDVVMPGGMSGIDLARELRRSDAETRVLFMSGYADEAAVGEDLAGRGEILLRKPFDGAELLAHVTRALAEAGE
jgi:two-component system cell cycle sensor histidine kinase/response regulator CckA